MLALYYISCPAYNVIAIYMKLLLYSLCDIEIAIPDFSCVTNLCSVLEQGFFPFIYSAVDLLKEEDSNPSLSDVSR